MKIAMIKCNSYKKLHAYFFINFSCIVPLHFSFLKLKKKSICEIRFIHNKLLGSSAALQLTYEKNF